MTQMKFDDLDNRMRVYEENDDHCVLPGLFIVTRLDGRSFTRLTKDALNFEAPFDERFRDYMVATVDHLMNCGFRIIFGYTQSDEISLLFHPNEKLFSRKTRKLISILAGEASAKFSSLVGLVAAFDYRISQLPTKVDVIEYFRWRSEDAHRNALSAHCYWILRKKGKSPGEATSLLDGMNVSQKNELLFQHGINFNDLPLWQKRGIGLIWQNYLKKGTNPVSGVVVETERRRIEVQYSLPLKDDYASFIAGILESPERE